MIKRGEKIIKVNPVRNYSGALNPAGIIVKSNSAAEQRGIISNGVNPISQENTLDLWLQNELAQDLGFDIFT